MAEEANKAGPEVAVQVAAPEEEVVVTDVPQADPKTTAPEKEPSPVPETEEVTKPQPVEEDSDIPKPAADDHEDKIDQSSSFKEESTRVADLPDPEKKALEELKKLIQEALNNHEFTTPPPPPPPPKQEVEEGEKPAVLVPVAAAETATATEKETNNIPEPENKAETKNETEEEAIPEQLAAAAQQVLAATPEETTVVGSEVIEEKSNGTTDAVDDDGAKTVEAIEETIVAVSSSVPQEQPLEVESKEDDDQVQLPAPPEEVSIWGIPLLADERSDVILLKFLRARDFKVKDAFTMIKNTVRWRKEFSIDQLLEQELGSDLEQVVFMHGFDKEGHPVCYNVYGAFQNKELYQKTFSDEEKRQKFLRWRIQFLEKSIRKLDFSPGGICTIVQVNDLKNSPGPGKWELRQATKQALQLLQDNYPEFVAKQVFINVPWWYLAVNRMISPFLTQRTRSKFVFAGPSKSAETLFRYIAAEQIPVKYGGLSKDGEFGTADAVTEITLKPTTKQTVEFPVTETCLLTWEVRVVGWDVSYGAEFVPSTEEGYTVIIQKARKVASTEEPVVYNSFKIGEPGKVVLTIDNPTSKKKKLLYRLKAKTFSD